MERSREKGIHRKTYSIQSIYSHECPSAPLMSGPSSLPLTELISETPNAFKGIDNYDTQSAE
jgi:hypothetical protein